LQELEQEALHALGDFEAIAKKKEAQKKIANLAEAAMPQPLVLQLLLGESRVLFVHLECKGRFNFICP